MSTGRTPSIKQVCEKIIAQGGMISAVGGNIEDLTKANADPNTDRRGKQGKRRTRFEIDPERSEVIPSADGSIFADHTITNAGTLRARYYEAVEIAKADRRAWWFWRTCCRQLLDFPTKQPPARR
ncbi:hypothetical protein JQ615_19785 [Bradyrhizobium jicamae]|uniref:Uncharacterized protein n=2 Tax=Bradyrhizobium jicamae TaxID=280332 RepID=A0ABS5FLI5_9BRAD|nr:hypothetical protein [Bradyrhizobium jicamae]